MKNIYKVFKFGGAATSIPLYLRNYIVPFISAVPKGVKYVVVFSAFGKVTNMLEDIYAKKREGNIEIANYGMRHLKNFFDFYISELFEECGFERAQKQKNKFDLLFEELKNLFTTMHIPSHALKPGSLNEITDRKQKDEFIAYGEKLSLQIVSAYLTALEKEHGVIDATKCINTDSNFGNAAIKTFETGTELKAILAKKENNLPLNIISGFIGHNREGSVTTTGREGSDISAIKIAEILECESCDLGKDQKGIYPNDSIGEGKSYKYIWYGKLLRMIRRRSKHHPGQVVHMSAICSASKAQIGEKKKSLLIRIFHFSKPEEICTVIGPYRKAS